MVSFSLRSPARIFSNVTSDDLLSTFPWDFSIFLQPTVALDIDLSCLSFSLKEDVTLYASMLKLKGGRLQREVADTCLQFWGGMGYADEMPISRAYRDGRLLSIAGGADEVMLGIISKLMGILPSSKKK